MNIGYKLLDAVHRLSQRTARKAAKPYKTDEANREAWVRARLAEVPAGSRLLDVGAGECRFKPDCSHLDYIAQDVAEYDGRGDGSGLQTGDWDFSRIDIVCDLLEIPEGQPYDCLLCTEVLEHVPDAPAAIRKFARLLNPGGQLILTAPFACLVHFAPYFFSSGYSEYFYLEHLENNGFAVDEIRPNGSYIRQVHGEVTRLSHVASSYTGSPLTFEQVQKLNDAAAVLRQLIDIEEAGLGDNQSAPSAQLSAHGFLVSARRKD